MAKKITYMKKIIFSLFLTLSAVSLTAADMKDVFSAMPDSVLPTLTRNNRLDMIDFVSSGMKAVVNDVFNEKSTLDTLTADYLHITLSEAVKVEMKLLPSSRQLVDSAEQVWRSLLQSSEPTSTLGTSKAASGLKKKKRKKQEGPTIC